MTHTHRDLMGQLHVYDVTITSLQRSHLFLAELAATSSRAIDVDIPLPKFSQAKAIDLKNGAKKVDPPDRLGRIEIHHGEANLNFGNTEPIVARRCGDIRLGNTLPLSSVIGNTETNAPSINHYHIE